MLEARYRFRISEAELLDGVEVLLPDNLKAIEGIYSFYVVDDLVAGYREATVTVDRYGRVFVSIDPLDELVDADLDDNDETLMDPELDDNNGETDANGSDSNESGDSDTADSNMDDPDESKENGESESGSEVSEPSEESKENITEDGGNTSQQEDSPAPPPPDEENSDENDEAKSAPRAKRAGLLRSDRYYFVEFTIKCEFLREKLPEIPDEGLWTIPVLSAGRFISVELAAPVTAMSGLLMPFSSGLYFHDMVNLSPPAEYTLRWGGTIVTGGQSRSASQWNNGSLSLQYNNFSISAAQLQAIQAAGTSVEYEIQKPGGLEWPVGVSAVPINFVSGPFAPQQFA